MLQDNSFGYLKANTVLFAQKTCEALSDMCGAQFLPLKETIREGAFTSPYHVIIYISFTGAIQGHYLLSFNEDVVLKLIGAYDERMTPQQVRDLREDFSGLLKETLNLAVGQSIEELEKSFHNLSFTPSTVVYGEIEFPNIMSGSIAIEGREGTMLCGFLLNLANLKIKEKLDEALHEVEVQTREAEESRRNIESILSLLPTGLLAINAQGIILPGFSKSTQSIIGLSPEEEVIGRYLPECIGARQEDHTAWKNWLVMVFTKYNDLPFADIKALCPLLEFTNTHNHILK
jgi:CheY-specific phosphatase CheX